MNHVGNILDLMVELDDPENGGLDDGLDGYKFGVFGLDGYPFRASGAPLGDALVAWRDAGFPMPGGSMHPAAARVLDVLRVLQSSDVLCGLTVGQFPDALSESIRLWREAGRPTLDTLVIPTADPALLAKANRALGEENDALRRQVAELQALGTSIHKHREAAARETEKRIGAHIRRVAMVFAHAGDSGHGMLLELAEDIEGGEYEDADVRREGDELRALFAQAGAGPMGDEGASLDGVRLTPLTSPGVEGANG